MQTGSRRSRRASASLVTTGSSAGESVVRVHGFEIRERDIFAAFMLAALAVFMVVMAIAHGRESCTSAPAVAAKTSSTDITGSVAAKNVPASFAIGEKLSAASGPPLRGATREWATAGSGPPLRGATREWAGAGDIGAAFSGVKKKIEAAGGERAGDIGSAFASVRKKVEAAGAAAGKATGKAARADLPRLMRGAMGRERDLARGGPPAVSTLVPISVAANEAGRMLPLSSRPTFEPPAGNQPGTLRLAEPGEQRVPPLFDLKFGYKSNGPQAGPTSVRSQVERLSAERDQGEGEGSYFEGWGGGHSIKSGIESSTWSEGKNWTAKKNEVREPMQKVCELFDDMFNAQVAPGASTERVNATDFVVRSNGACVDPARYYEFVGATMAAQMGAQNVSLPAWAQNAEITLGLENLKASVPGLRSGITVDCASAPTYKLGADGSLLRSSGQPVSFDVPWPADNSILITHVMKLK
jgi:hypothetical protein